MIIFVGNRLHGGFAAEAATMMENEPVEFVEASGHIRECEDSLNALIATYGGCRAIVYDVDEFYDEAHVIVEEVVRFQKTSGGDGILLAPTISASSVIVAEALDAGIRKLIDRSTSMADQKSQLLNCLSGDYDVNRRKELEEIERQREERKKRMGACKTIGVMGACRRIGTSTQCFQIVRYLQSLGYKACYVEMNTMRYPNLQLRRKGDEEVSFVIKNKLSLKTRMEDPDIGLVDIEGIDMFYDSDRLPEILEKNYDYYVYDYGEYRQRNFNKASFLKDDIQIIITGAGAGELDYTLNILQNISYAKAVLVFSFTAPSEREEIVDFMEDYKAGARSYFAEYTPNPFVLSNMELYEKLLHLDRKEGMPDPQKKRRGLFGRRKQKYEY